MAYYVFTKMTASNGVKLAYIKTSPNNIKLTYLGGQTVPNSGKLGMNGGFFQDYTTGMTAPQPYVYSIAVNNNVPINGTFDTYGSGGKQDISRGTLVWDKTTRAYFIQQTTIGDQATLWVGWNDNYWAQGGISMNLQSDSTWRQTAIDEGIPVIDDTWPQRSGLLYNNGLNIFLVISENSCSAGAFRDACKEIEPSTVKEGIFLDGANAVQMNVPGTYSTTSTRKLSAMIEVVHNVDL